MLYNVCVLSNTNISVPMTHSSLCWGLMQGHLKIAAGDTANVPGKAEEAPLNGRNCSLKRQYSLLSLSE